MANLILPTQALVLNAYAVLIGSSPGNAAFKDHQAFINTPGVGSNGYKAALETFVAGTSTASLATTMLANLGLGALFTQAQAVAFLTANPGNRVGAMMDLAALLYGYSGTDAALLTAKTAYVSSIDGSYVYSNNTANVNGQDFAGAVTAGKTYALTALFDNLVGTAFADTFTARTIGNANTLNDGDRIDGGAGNDTVYVDFANSNGGLAITPVLKNVETVVIRAQGIPVDATNGNNVSSNNGLTSTNTVQIDAQRSLDVNVADRVVADFGVTRWESNNSRSDVVIEDVRIGNAQKTKDITIAMVETDPGNVDFAVYFDQLSLRNSGGGTSTLVLRIMDTGAAAAAATAATPLLNNPYDTFKIGVNGALQSISLNSTATPAAAAAADTYAQLLTAFQAALALSGTATAALGADFSVIDPLSGLTVTGKEIVLTGAAGLSFSSVAGSGWFNTTGAAVPNNSNIYTLFTTGSTSVTELVTSTVVLDDVGRGSTGGDLLIGGLSAGQTSTSRGVERFEITVEDNSKLQTINSTNNALREVTIKNGVTNNTVANAYVVNGGNLTVNGDAVQPGATGQGGNNLFAGVEDNSPFGDHHGNGAAGFADVRLIDGSAMTGNLAFTASVSLDSIAKYVTRVDTAANPVADIAGIGNINFNVPGANFAYAGGAGNDTIVTTIDGGVAASRSNIVSGQSDFTFLVEGGAGNDAITVNLKPGANLNGGLENWANNQDLNNNITINAGAGNDTIRTPGTGDIVINAGEGNDTVYTDNTGRQAVSNLNGAVGINTNTTTSNAVFVFNTFDQVNAIANGAARNVADLRSGANDSYNFYKGTLTVTFKGLTSAAVTLGNAATFKTTDLEINQAIKNAINTNETLNKLLVAQDGPGNTLVVTSLIDGVMSTADLTVAFAAPAATTTYSSAEVTGMAAAYGNAAITTSALALMNQVLPSAGRTDYSTAMGQDPAGTNIVGAASISTSDNFVTPGTGNDVIVLGTTVGVDVARSSNEVVTLDAGFGDDVIVNFNATGFGIDHLNVGAFLTSAAATTVGALALTDNLVTVVNLVAATNGTDALVTTLVKAAIDTGVTVATKQVYIVVNGNVGTVYSITNGTAANDAVVTRQGTVALADTVWTTLTPANFMTVGAQAEGASSAPVAAALNALANAQILVGTAGIDTLSTNGFTGVTMTGGASADTFTVTTGSTGSIITDLTTGDNVTVGGTGVVVANNVAAFVATAATANNGAGFTINSLAAGSTIDMSLAATSQGYTLAGAAGNDVLTGSAGNDTLSSGATGTDVLNGGAGDDTMTSGGGTVTFNGGAGNDTITGGAGIDTINVTAGVDTITAFGTAADVITVSAGAIANVTSNAIFTATAASSNSGTLNFTSGSAGAYNFALMTGTAGVNFTGVVGVDTFTGTAQVDRFVSGGDADIVTGGKGGDIIGLTAGTASVLNVAVLDTAIAANFAAAATTAAFSASQTTVGMDVITNFSDTATVQLSVGTAITTSTVLLTGATATLGAATVGDVILLRGTYSAASNTFLGAIAGTDSMLVYDTNGTTAAGTYEGIVLVGYIDAGGADTISATGLFTAVA